MRYKFYREHKYVSYRLNELERLIAKTNFISAEETQKLETEFNALKDLLAGHAAYETERLHPLLKNKGSALYQTIEHEHHDLDDSLKQVQLKFNEISKHDIDESRVEAGYQFYLEYRRFVGENLLHLHDEETILLPELQRLYTDEELKQVEFYTYQQMTPQQMIHMIQELFPQMNTSDKEAFLSDIQESQPEKFREAWERIIPFLTSTEQEYFIKKLKIDFTKEQI